MAFFRFSFRFSPPSHAPRATRVFSLHAVCAVCVVCAVPLDFGVVLMRDVVWVCGACFWKTTTIRELGERGLRQSYGYDWRCGLSVV